MKIKDISPENRPRERMKILGTDALSDAELLALILRSGSRGENAIDAGNRLISKFGFEKLQELSIKELKSIRGIGEVKAMQILASFEISRRISRADRISIKDSKDVYEHFKKLMHLDKEHFYILLLNTKNKILREELVSIGTLDTSIVHPREIFRPAIREGCASIILVHNHPSGDCTPSPQDIDITERLSKIGEEIGIQILDHVIIGRKHWSWKENV